MRNWLLLAGDGELAEALPVMLGQARRRPARFPWSDLAGLVSGRAAPVGWAVLDEIAPIIRGMSPWDGMPAVEAAAAIMAWCRQAGGTAPAPAEQARITALLTARAQAGMRAAGGDEDDYVRQLRALMLVRGSPSLARLIGSVGMDEHVVRCPGCTAEVHVQAGPGMRWCAHMGPAERHRTACEGMPVLPAADLGAPAGDAELLRDLLVGDGYPGLAARLRYLCGLVQCASCGAGFRLSESLGSAGAGCGPPSGTGPAT